MKKAKILGLLSAPIALSAMPLFTTSCSDAEHITVEDEISFESKAKFDAWKDTGMYNNFIERMPQWTTADFNEAGISANDSIFKASVLDQFTKNLNEHTARAAIAYSIAQNCAYDVDQLADISWPATLSYSIDVRYNKDDKTITGIISSDFTCSSNVTYSCSVYIPNPIKAVATYSEEPEGEDLTHNVVVFNTTDGKETVKSQSTTRYENGTIQTITVPQSFARFDFTIFMKNFKDTYTGPNKNIEIQMLTPLSAKPTAETVDIVFNKIDIKNNSRTIYEKKDITFTINYDETDSYQYAHNITVTTDEENEKYILTNKNTPTDGAYPWPNKMYLNAHVKDKTGNWTIDTIKLYPSS